MLIKLSLTGIKSRLKDYFVLFSGLIMSSAIFYMFETLALNQSFVKNNSPLQMATVVFQVGSVLLGIITLVYILYANTFLMSMRQRDYGMFMMLGAKRFKIAELIFAETLVIGLLSTIVGSVLGIGLTKVVSSLLLSRLEITITHFNAFYLPALIVTFVFFLILFIVTAIINQIQLLKTPVLQLLNSTKQPTRFKRKRLLSLIEVVLGLILLVSGYYTMSKMASIGIPALFIALFTITGGTYCLFNAFFVWLINLMKKNHKIADQNLNNFTLSQLSFRIKDYTKILSLVAMLFALALGAISVGMSYQAEIPKMAANTTAYDVILHQPNATSMNLIKQLETVKNKASYQLKTDRKNIYYNLADFKKQPYIYKAYSKNSIIATNKVATVKQLQSQEVSLTDFQVRTSFDKKIRFLNPEQFEQIQKPSQTILAIRVTDFMQDLPIIKKLYQQELKTNKDAVEDVYKYNAYQSMNAIFSGFEFMGFFLGIAFLAMLASCLMFKILSGAASDIKRYEMLDKIGTRQKLLKQSISREIGVLFLLPGIIGIMHVLFGLQMFKPIMLNPYGNLLVPFTIFIVLYSGYYILTNWLYQKIVLPK